MVVSFSEQTGNDPEIVSLNSAGGSTLLWGTDGEKFAVQGIIY